MKKKLVAIATATICMAGTVNFPAFAASKFADINDVPWSGAAQYIDEAAALGLMAGYTENGKKLCKAKNNVTYCEAVQLMYSIMGANDSTQKVSSTVVSKWKSIMQGANIPEWAYDSVAYGLENSIISQNDIKLFITSGNQNNARREDVAVIFGKALAKLYKVNPNASITYNDKNTVSSTSIPYLELLNRLSLMVGDSSNNFNPKAYINRAEMAVLSAKTYNKLKDSSTPITTEQFTGTVKEVATSGKDTVITVDVAGKTKTFTITSSTTVIKDNQAINASKIAENDTIVIVVSNNATTFVTVLFSSGASESSKLSGTISSITTKKISIKNDSSTTSYSFEKRYNNIVVKLDGSSSDVDELIKAYKDGDNLTAKVTLDSEGYVVRIDATTEENQLSGTLTSMSSSKISIKYDGKTYSYNLPDDTDDVSVTINGSSSTYSKLKSNYSSTTYTVKITLDKDKEVSKIVATGKSSDSSSVSGELYSISKSSIKIVKSDDSKKSYDIDSDATVTIDGSSSKLSTLISRVEGGKDYEVKLTISDNKVTKIAATLSDGTTSDSVKGTLVDADGDDGIRIKTSSSGSSKWYLWASSGYEIKLNGSYSNIQKLLDKMDNEKVTVTLTLNGAGRVTKVTATSSDDEDESELEGTITSLTKSRIKIKLDSGSTKSYDLASSVTVKVDGSTKSISKLIGYIDEDDETYSATLKLNSDGDVKTIEANISKELRTGTLISINEDKMVIKTDSSTYSYDLASSVTVKVDGDNMDLDDFINKYILYTYEVTISRNSSNNVTKIVAEKK